MGNETEVGTEGGRMSIGGHHRGFRGKSNDWITPKYIINSLGVFDLDPCASNPQPWPTARVMWSLPKRNGLEKPWKGRVWLNPPYGPETGVWLKKLVTHGNGIALVFSRTETRMFFESVWRVADAVFFFEGRLKFYRSSGRLSHGRNAGGPSCLICFGRKNVMAVKRSGLKGVLINPEEAA